MTLAGADAEGCRSRMDVAGERVGAEAADPRGVEKFVSEGREAESCGWALGGQAGRRASVLVSTGEQFRRPGGVRDGERMTRDLTSLRRSDEMGGAGCATSGPHPSALELGSKNLLA